MKRHGIELTIILVLSMACSQAYATHIQYVSPADVSGTYIGSGDTWSWTFDLVNDPMYLWEINSPTSTYGPTPDINTADAIGSYDPLNALHYVTLRVDPNNSQGTSTSNFIELTVNGVAITNWTNPISLYDWGVPFNPISDIFGIANNNYVLTVALTGLNSLGSTSLAITNVNIEGCFDKSEPVPATVPEPATILLIGAGLIVFTGLTKKYRTS